jgi:hypothetical protein
MVVPDMCGVMAWFGMYLQEWSFDGGCGNQTSPLYPTDQKKTATSYQLNQ